MRFTQSLNTTFIIHVTLCFLLPFNAVQAGLNKWVDEKGNVHYGDRVPADYLKKEHSLLNEQGVTLSTKKAMKTDEELEAEKKQLAIKAKEDTLRLIAEKKQALHDRMLLDTFTTERDFILAIEARIDTVNSQISLAETLIKNDEKRLNDVKLHIKTIQSSGRTPPQNLHKEVTTISYQIENNYAYVEDKTNERTEIQATFEKDLKRYRQLIKAKQQARENKKVQSQNSN